MITLTGKIHALRDEISKIDDLARGYASCKRYAYQRLLEGRERNELKRNLPDVFNINSRYSDDAILEAKALIAGTQEAGKDPHKVVFGGKSLQRQLSKKHLSKKERDKKKTRWNEKRIGVYSRGDKSKDGNLNLRISYKDDQFFVRINLGDRKWITVPWKSNHKKMDDLKEVLRLGLKYNVRLTKKNGVYYIHITIDEEFPEAKFNFTRGAIGIDLNAFPAHIAWAEVNSEGNYEDSGVISTPDLYDGRKGKRDHQTWQFAHQIVDLAKQKRKGIVLEDLKFDRSKEEIVKKKRRCFSNFTYSKLKERICIVAKREGVPVVEVNPAYTSIIGSLKYAPQFSLSRHTSAAMVIARRGLGFSENVPTAYQGIISDTLLVSSQRGPSGEAGIHQRKEEASVKQRKLQTIWSVLDVVVLTGRFTGKNLSALKRMLVRGNCEKRGCEPHGSDPPLGSGSVKYKGFASRST